MKVRPLFRIRLRVRLARSGPRPMTRPAPFPVTKTAVRRMLMAVGTFPKMTRPIELLLLRGLGFGVGTKPLR
jgi:hypothetical protein